MNIITKVLCPQHNEEILFLDLNKNIEKGKRALCSQCQLCNPTNLFQALVKWDLQKEEEKQLLSLQSLALIEPLNSLEKYIQSLKNQLQMMINRSISMIEDIKAEIILKTEEALKTLAQFDTIQTLSQLQDIAIFVADKQKVYKSSLEDVKLDETSVQKITQIGDKLFEQSNRFIEFIDQLQNLYNLTVNQKLKAQKSIQLYEIGMQYHSRGQVQIALDFYEQAISENKNNYSAQLQKGDILFQQNEAEQAIKSYNKALKANPKYEKAYHKKGSFCYNLGITLQSLERYKEAIYCYDQALSINEQYQDVLNDKGIINEMNTQGSALKELKRFDDEIKCYDQSIQINPVCCTTFFKKGLALENLKKYADALQCFNQVIELNPKHQEVYSKKGEILLNIHSYEDAIRCFNEALFRNPLNLKALLNKGQALHWINKNSEAINCYDEAIYSNPKYLEAFILKGEALRKLKQYNEAIICFEHSLNLDPKSSVAYNELGTTLCEMRQYKMAIDYFNLALQLNPKFTEALTNKGLLSELSIGIALHVSNQREKALEFFDKALSIDPKFIMCLTSKGKILNELLKFEEATIVFELAIKINPQSEKDYYFRGVALFELAKFNEALSCCDESLRIFPNFYLASYTKGKVLMTIGKLKEAVKEIKGVLSHDPDFFEANLDLGLALHNMQECRQAIYYFKIANEIYPQNPFPMYYKGTMKQVQQGLSLYQLGCYEEAIECEDIVLQSHRKFSLAMIIKGSALIKLQKLTEALRYFDQAIYLSPDNQQVLRLKYETLLALGRFQEAQRVYELGAQNQKKFFENLRKNIKK